MLPTKATATAFRRWHWHKSFLTSIEGGKHQVVPSVCWLLVFFFMNESFRTAGRSCPVTKWFVNVLASWLRNHEIRHRRAMNAMNETFHKYEWGDGGRMKGRGYGRAFTSSSYWIAFTRGLVVCYVMPSWGRHKKGSIFRNWVDGGWHVRLRTVFLIEFTTFMDLFLFI